MKFAKVLEQTLIEEDIPEEWIEAAIQYKSLKKCINKVVSELQFLGLEQNTLKLIIDDKTRHQVVEMDNNEYTPNNPVVAEYTLTKSNFDQSDHIIPMLKISIDYNNADVSDDHINEIWLRLKSKIETLIDNDDSIIESVSNRIYELNEDQVLSPHGSRREGSPIPEDCLEQIVGKNLDKSSKRSEMLIMLKSDSQFFQMLNGELENLDKLKQDEETKLIQEVNAISESIQKLANPAKGPLRKSDLYKWRELFKIYLDSEVYFKYNETSVSASERNGEQVKRNLNEFIRRVEKTSLTDQFQNKKSMVAFNQFLNMNFHLLKVLQFQSINSTAFRKILKKFDKQTSLGVKYKFPKLISNDHIFITGSSIAQSICYVIQSSILTLVPQLDDYTCPICTSVAFKPIKLNCGHIFCVRCLVKLKQQKKVDCPICRRENSIAYADSTNLDVEAMALMKQYFPLEVKEKLKERDKERYDEIVGDSKCIIT
ncbi:uncharacterized protein AC631_02942 [Debaryomyces fabryi]|uniref:RING-14 protein n=1 Tax=Debaryomyces fabryi TaxID=58627 RepID=A0A0V1PYH4_9ASCO|nr:uncharacterized protein AC631_02942 [Debaryomyces fabryi]KSA01310.1 hypothetical protein AC631_02942 [Debaryomyces fabryi]CUM46999.1 unnamed protein product [Debaryomyces fabryi]